MGWAASLGPAFLTLWTADGRSGVRQGVATSNAHVVVVLIPGFPIESIVFGILLGMAVVLLIRRTRRGRRKRRE